MVEAKDKTTGNMLLSYRFRLPGIVLTIAGLTLAIFYFAFDLRFRIPVFALVSSFVKTKFFTGFTTNFADELVILVLLTGLILIAFSAERKEGAEYNGLRFKALKMSLLIDSLILFASVLFIYGGGFIAIVILNIFLPLALYILLFRLYLQRHKKRKVQVNPDI
ncbi:MAG: hypothetical protein RBU28_08410 [Bacteroidales bacterium]|jgi:hypothetical protein|nr:hypothetical protein [Bacteroidales bacterium]